MKRAWKGYALISPMLAGFLLFYVIPFGQVVWDSLSQGTGKSQLFVGLENYSRMFQNNMFLLAFGNTLKFLGIGLPLILILAYALALFLRLCHNKQLINSHFYRGVSELPYKLLFAVIYTHLEFRYEVSHTITSHHVHHFHQTRIPDGTLLDYMVQYRKPLFPQFFLYPKKFLPENNPHHKEFHLRPYIQNNANQ